MDNKKIEVYAVKRDSISKERIVVNVYSTKIAKMIGHALRNLGREACSDGEFEKAEDLLVAGNEVLKKVQNLEDGEKETEIPSEYELPLV